MRESDERYFKRRAGDERLAAERATDPCAQRAHLDLADRYDDAAAALQIKVSLAALAGIAGARDNECERLIKAGETR